MERYNFGTYQVNDENRSAYTHCHAVANLTSVAPNPILLLGEPGCGKTHLLYSVVNRVRSQFSDVGIAYINSEEFPETVRDLILDPSPLRQTAEAVLLVDDLDSFTGEGEILEAVIRLFMNEEHFIIVASNVHPKRLKQLPDTLRSLISQSTICPIHLEQSLNPSPDVGENAHADQGKDLERLKQDIAALQAQSINAGIASNLERLNTNADDSLLLALKEELEDVRTQLGESRDQLVDVRTELEETKIAPGMPAEVEGDDFNELKLQIENLKGENALLSFAEKESRGLREQLKRANEELESIQQGEVPAEDATLNVSASADPNNLQSEAEEKIRIADEMRTALDEERVELVAERDDIAKQFLRLQALKESIENTNRSQLDTTATSETFEHLERGLEKIIVALEISPDSLSGEDSFEDIASLIHEQKSERLNLMENLTETVDELSDAHDRIDDLTTDLEQEKLLMTDMEMAMEVLRNEGYQGQLDLKGQIKKLEESLVNEKDREARRILRSENLDSESETPSEETRSSTTPFKIVGDHEGDQTDDENSTGGVHLDSADTNSDLSSRIISLESRTMYHVEEIETDNLTDTGENQTG